MGVEADLMRKSRKMKMTSSWIQGVSWREGEYSGDLEPFHGGDVVGGNCFIL
jgi:hypothetical protein